MYTPKRVALAWLAILLVAPSLAAAEPAEKARNKNAFVRLSRAEDKTPLALETPILRFMPADGDRKWPVVDLIAAVHIADKAYYEQLNREFKNYDAVLYELVAPEESRVPRPGDPESSHPISLLQNGMKDILDLQFQLQGIDYTQPNMVHADMSPDEFAKSMEQRGESVLTMFTRMLGYAMTQQGASGGDVGAGELLAALFSKNRSLTLKRLLAEQFENSEGTLLAIDGPNGSTLISGRNKVALDVLRREIASGKRKFAIFYGAAHMPDFQKRLRDEFGLKPAGARWLVAWNLKS